MDLDHQSRFQFTCSAEFLQDSSVARITATTTFTCILRRMKSTVTKASADPLRMGLAASGTTVAAPPSSAKRIKTGHATTSSGSKPPKSTITQTNLAALSSMSNATIPAVQSNNAASSSILGLVTYDSILDESETLLLAACEAQQLGRLKLATSYLRLLHARLIPLGKRLDAANAAAAVHGKHPTPQTPSQQELKMKRSTETLLPDDRATTTNEAACAATVSRNDSLKSMTDREAFSSLPAIAVTTPLPNATTATRSIAPSSLTAVVAHLDSTSTGRSGRGKKPETTAFYTAPHAVCDIRELLRRGQRQMAELQQEQERLQETLESHGPSHEQKDAAPHSTSEAPVATAASIGV